MSEPSRLQILVPAKIERRVFIGNRCWSQASQKRRETYKFKAYQEPESQASETN